MPIFNIFPKATQKRKRIGVKNSSARSGSSWFATLLWESNDSDQQQKPAPVIEMCMLRTQLEQLHGILNLHPDTRKVLKHLAYIEERLALFGYKVLDEVPVKVLERGSEQLIVVTENGATEELIALRELFLKTLSSRNTKLINDFLDDGETLKSRMSGVEVTEARHSDFFILDGEIIPDRPK